MHYPLEAKNMAYGIWSKRMGNAFVIASKYSVDVLFNVGSDGLRENGNYSLNLWTGVSRKYNEAHLYVRKMGKSILLWED